MDEAQVIKNLPKSILSAIKNSIGSHTWQNFYASVDGVEKDVMQGGELSCAYYVSSILATFGLIDRAHATVPSLVENLPQYGWRKVKTPKPGDLLVYKNREFNGTPYPHIGFYIGANRAISNSAKEKVPVEHDWLMGDENLCQIESIWHKDL